jgi:hypothetical protein
MFPVRTPQEAHLWVSTACYGDSVNWFVILQVFIELSFMRIFFGWKFLGNVKEKMPEYSG